MTETTMPTIPTEEELRRQVPAFAAAACVFLSGSVIAGFGHPNSDIDVYVCLESPGLRDRVVDDESVGFEFDSANPVRAFYVDRRRWDVEYVVTADVDELLSRVERTQVAERAGLTYGQIDLLYRISAGRPVRSAGVLATWQRRIASSRLVELLQQRYLTVSDGFLEDALGLLAIDDVATAAYCTRLAFEASTDALLVGSGCLCPNPKWRIAQLRQRAAGPVDLKEYLRVIEMQGYDGRAWVESTIDRVRSLAFDV